MGKNDFCCAPACSNNRKRNPDLKFYRIPKEAKRRKAWLERIRRQDLTPTDNTRLCSAHFIGGEKSENPRHNDYIPSVFEFTHKKCEKRKTRTSQRTENCDLNVESTPKTKRKRRSVSGECKGRPRDVVHSLEDHEVWGTCLQVDHPLKQHDYCKPQVDPTSLDVSEEVLQELTSLQSRVIELEEENEKLRSKCLILDVLKHDDEKFHYWTGFPNYATFQALFDYLDAIAVEKKKAWRGTEMALSAAHQSSTSKRGPASKLTSEEELFMVIVRLRVGLSITDLAQRFSISESSVSKLFTAWINLMYFHLKDLCQMPQCEEHGKAKQFESFPDLKVIVDCTEIFTQKPSSLRACKEIYSNYKSHTTFKFLVAINAHGGIVYVSRAWGGRTSDKHITSNSVDFMATLKAGEEVMADRGFDINEVMKEKGVKVTIPDFKGTGRSQLKGEEGKRSEKIAEARIHVERAIQRIKTFQILTRQIPLSMAHLVEQIFIVCSYLVNFQAPILRQ